MRRNLSKLLMTLLLLSVSPIIANSQVSLYDFIQSNSTYTELTGATNLAVASGTSGSGSLDDLNYTLANGTIPFTFVYDGVSYTGCTVSTNGYITFGTTTPATNNYTPISTTTAFAGAVSALGGNLNAYFVSGNSAQTGSISYQTLGSAPNRRFVIQFKNFKPQAQSGATYTTAMNFQIILNETSNAIDVIYNFTTGTYTAGSYQVGLRGANNTYPTNIRNRSIVTGTNTWATSTVGTANTSTCGISSTLLPAQGLTFRYAPTTCPSPTNLTATQITTNSATLSWTNPVTGGSFTVEYGPVGFTPGTGTTINTSSTSATITGLSALTSYSFYVQKSCGVGGTSLKIGPSNFSTGGVGEDCSTAQLLPVAASLGSCSYTTVSTGVSINGPTSFCSDVNGNQATNDKWFKFVAPANGKKLVLTTQAGTNNDWVMEVWTGCPGGTGYQLKCGDDQNGAMPEISMCQNEYVAGQTYYVRVWTYIPFSTGTMNICIYETTMCAVAPSNDNCANAIRLSVNPPLSCATNARTFLNNYATRNTDAASCDPSLLKGDVWFVFNTGNFSDVDLTINANTAVNVKAQLLFECGGFEIACWNPGTGTKTVTGLNPQADYILRVWTDSTSAGTFSICITDRCSNPTATTSGSYTVCTGSSVSIPVTFTGTPPFSLTYSNGSSSSSVTGITTTNYNLIVSPSTTSTYTLTAMNDATCVGSASGSASVTVITPQTVTLNAFSPVCDNAPLLLLSGGSPSGGVYSGVGVSNGYFDPSFGTQTITYTVTYGVGCSRSASQIYTVNPIPSVTLSSFSPVCNTTTAFALSGGTPTGGNYVGSGVTNNVFNPAIAGIGTHIITYFYTTPAGCTGNDTSSIIVSNCSVCANPPTANAGIDKSICSNTTANISGSIGGAATSLTWSGGAGIYSPNNTSTTITYTPSASEISAGFARLILTTNDPDGNGPCVAAKDTMIVSITAGPSAVSVLGLLSVCKNQNGVVYSISAQTGSTYNWTVPNGVSISSGQGSNSITTFWGPTAISGNVGVTVTNNCGSVIGSIPVAVGVAPTTPTISGSSSVCSNQTGVVYSVVAQSGVTYNWIVPAGVLITAGVGTNSITTTWSTTGGNVGVTLTNNCGSTTASLPVSISANTLSVGPISGNSPICRPASGVVYSVVSQPGVTYAWTLPTGVTATAGAGTNSITTSWSSSSVTSSIKVVGTSGCGKDSTTRTITVRTALPTQPGTITGASTACIGDLLRYSIKKVTTADYYIWTPKTGMLINGSATPVTTTDTAVTVTFTTGFVGDTLKVNAGNCKGLSTVRTKVISRNTAAPTTPGVLTGATTGVCGSTVTYSFASAVTNATSYTWRTKNGTALLNGQAVSSLTIVAPTQSVTVTFPNNFTTDTLYVKSNNGCGSSAERAVRITAKPATPGTITTPTTLCIGTSVPQVFSIAAVSGATSYTWTYPTSGTTYVSGQGTTNLTLRFTATGSKSITVKSGNACGLSSAKSVSVNPTAACPTARDGSAYDLSGIVVYPNPTRGSVTIAYTSLDYSDYVLTIYDMSGRVIDTYTLNATEGYNQKELNLETLVKGTYIVSLKGSGLVTQTRLVIE